MTHLTSDELIDAMEGGLAADRHAHLAACEDCRRQLDDVVAVLSETRQVGVPEPSPLFWTHFSERVRASIENESPTRAWPAWLRWQTLLPLGAVAMLIVGLMISIPMRQPNTTTPTPDPVTSIAAVDAAAADNWDALAEIVGELDLDTASEAGVIAPGLAEQAVLELTADERLELTRLLQAELARAKS